LAVGRDHSQLEPAHLLLALLDQQGGTVQPLLGRAGFDVKGMRNELGKQLDSFARIQSPSGDVRMSQELAKLLNLADRYAQKAGDKFVSSETVLVAAMLDKGGELGKLLHQFGDIERLQQAVDTVRGGETVDDADAESHRQALERFTVDLTARAEAGKLD